jgi:hypothetical protein
MKRLSRVQQVRATATAIFTVVVLTLALRHQIDFSDNGVVVIWIAAMLLLTAAIRRYVATSTGEDGRLEMEEKVSARVVRPFLQRFFPNSLK